MTAIVIDFAAAKRRIIAFRLERAQRCDVCESCGLPLGIRERGRFDRVRGLAWHFACALRVEGLS